MGKIADEIKFLTVDAGARKAGEYLDSMQVKLTNLEAAINACCDDAARARMDKDVKDLRAEVAAFKELRAELATVKELRAEVMALKEKLNASPPR